jgi:hypothetical protein
MVVVVVVVCLNIDAPSTKQKTVAIIFSRARGVYLSARIKAPSFAWTSKKMSLRSLSSYNENEREARAVFSGAACSNEPFVYVLIDDS